MHRWRTACSDAQDAGLHGVEGTLDVQPYRGTNPLYRHGPIRVAADRRHFEHADGTPFFWLGDTWWMGLCHRLHWSEEFRQLADDRRAKGFTVVQIVAGLYPDMPAFDPPGGNNWGTTPWDDAMRLPGSAQVAHAKRFFESLPWNDLQPMPDTVAWRDTAEVVVLGDWIWFPEGDPKRDAPVEARFFRRRFELAPGAVVRRATLRVSADDLFSAWLNGRQLGSGADWSTPTTIDATAALRTGPNLPAIRAENGKAPVAQNPAGLNAALDIELADGGKLSVRTAAEWRTPKTGVDGWTSLDFNDSAWPAALVSAGYGDPPWGHLSAERPDRAPLACGIGDRLRVCYVPASRPVALRALRPQATYRVTLFDPVTGQRQPGGKITAGTVGQWHCAPPQHGHDWLVLLEG